MPFAKITVTKPLNRLIYIGGNYAEPAGNSSTDTFIVPSGRHIFETLNGADTVDFRKRFLVRPNEKKKSIELDRVDPPEPI